MVQRLLRIARSEFKVQHASFAMLSLPWTHMAVPYVRTTYPIEWISQYLMHRLMVNDPVVRVGLEARVPFYWSDISCTVAESSVMALAKHYGLGTLGISVPTCDVGPYRGLLSLTAAVDDEKAWKNRVGASVDAISSCAMEMHAAARMEVDAVSPLMGQLSPREVECLRFVAAGKTYTEIAGILKISEHTVRVYCKAVRMKLHSSTLAQAVATGCAMKIL